jgi:hypothetical protein
VTVRLPVSRRLTSFAIVIGLLGASAVLLVFVQAPGSSPQPRRAGHGARQRRSAAMAPAAIAPAGQALAGKRAAAQVMTAAARTGLRLMSEAATACESVAFHGYQMAAWWGPNGGSAAVVQLWHRPGGAILARSTNTAADPASTRQSDPATALDQSEIMTVTPALLALMRQNYLITYAGKSAVDGRPAQQVAISTRSGAIAARYWLDTATKLPLRRELFDASGQIFSEDAFIGVSFGASQLGSMPAAAAQPWAGNLTPADRSALRAAGWRLPGASAGGLTMFSATDTSASTGKVVEMSYSDGLSIISVFVQRGELPKTLPGWRRIAARGPDAVYAIDPDDRTLTWSARGFVYTMISNAAPDVVGRALNELPHDSPAGFWARMGRGFHRMVTWANPFG